MVILPPSGRELEGGSERWGIWNLSHVGQLQVQLRGFCGFTHTLLPLPGRERGLHAALRPRAVVLDTRQHQVGGVHMKAVAFVYLCDEALDQLVVEFQRATAACALQMVVVELADPLKHGVAGTEARPGDQANTAQVAQYPVDRRFIETVTVVAERRNDLGDGHVSLHFAEDLDDSVPGRCGPKP